VLTRRGRVEAEQLPVQRAGVAGGEAAVVDHGLNARRQAQHPAHIIQKQQQVGVKRPHLPGALVTH
jgi:hypothetical protein